MHTSPLLYWIVTVLAATSGSALAASPEPGMEVGIAPPAPDHYEVLFGDRQAAYAAHVQQAAQATSALAEVHAQLTELKSAHATQAAELATAQAELAAARDAGAEHARLADRVAELSAAQTALIDSLAKLAHERDALAANALEATSASEASDIPPPTVAEPTLPEAQPSEAVVTFEAFPSDKTVRGVLARWAAAAGYELSWALGGQDWAVSFGGSFGHDFLGATDALLGGINDYLATHRKQGEPSVRLAAELHTNGVLRVYSQPSLK